MIKQVGQTRCESKEGGGGPNIISNLTVQRYKIGELLLLCSPHVESEAMH